VRRGESRTRLIPQPHDDMELNEVHRRIRNILSSCPAISWSLQESVIVFDALARIVRTRQSGADLIDLLSRRSLGEAIGEFGQ